MKPVAMNDIYMHNSIRDYLIALGIIVLGIALVRAFKHHVIVRVKKWSEKTTNTFDGFVVDTIDRLGIPAVYLIIVYAGLNYLTFSPKWEGILKNAVAVAITFLVIRLVSSVVLLLLKSYLRKQERGTEKVKQLAGLMILINVVIWTVGMLFLFDNMGYNITALITGLGIGGIAVALAAQNILGDLFNYFVIFLDRPFEVNDFVTVDDKMGTVEYIGIKTTRLLSLTGEQLVFSNSDLTNSRIHNFKRMETRRIVFTIRVVYDISPEKLRQIPVILREIVEEQAQVRFDRAHWLSFEESSLNFEVVYIVLSSDYNVYMDIQQAINLRIFEKFNELEIGFAYPTRTFYIKSGETSTDPDTGLNKI